MGDSGSSWILVIFFHHKAHKVLTYVDYRAVSDVFQNIDPHPLLPLASVSSPLVLPHTKGGGYTHSPGGEGDRGSIFWKTPAIGLASYNNLSTIKPL